MSNNTKSFIGINKYNELVINNKRKKTYKINETNDKIVSLQFENTIKHFFLTNKIDGSTINILIG